MSAIPPPNVLGAAMQLPGAQRPAAAEREAETSFRSAMARELTGADKAVDVEIESTDADTRVHADAGGQGGAGRGFQREPEEPSPDDAADTMASRDAERPRLDLRI